MNRPWLVSALHEGILASDYRGKGQLLVITGTQIGSWLTFPLLFGQEEVEGQITAEIHELLLTSKAC